MKILDHDSCPQLAGNTTRFEQAVNLYYKHLETSRRHFRFLPFTLKKTGKMLSIELWQRLHDARGQSASGHNSVSSAAF